jgi:hypothetical protein
LVKRHETPVLTVVPTSEAELSDVNAA